MRPKPTAPEQQEQSQPQEDEIKFANNGGGGGQPKSFFQTYSSSSAIVCRPDPNNPGKQICTRTETTDTFDPFKGHTQRRRESNFDD